MFNLSDVHIILYIVHLSIVLVHSCWRLTYDYCNYFLWLFTAKTFVAFSFPKMNIKQLCHH